MAWRHSEDFLNEGVFPTEFPPCSFCSAGSGCVLELFSLEGRRPGFRLSLRHGVERQGESVERAVGSRVTVTGVSIQLCHFLLVCL